MSVQETVVILLSGIWLRKTPAVTFANSNLPGKRYRIFQTKKEIRNLPEDGRDLNKICWTVIYTNQMKIFPKVIFLSNNYLDND